MSHTSPIRLTGHCACRHTQYQLNHSPLFVHCCHCTRCQTQSGSAFALNALIETQHLTVTHGHTENNHTPTPSGKGQTIARCRRCNTALWSHYGGLGPAICFVRVGTLDNPLACPPDIHIYTSTKQPWVHLPHSVPFSEAYYQPSKLWPKHSLKRLKKALA